MGITLMVHLVWFPAHLQQCLQILLLRNVNHARIHAQNVRLFFPPKV
jgi:hypothetical protein